MTNRRRSALPLVLLATVLLFACQEATPPFECTDAIGCVNIAPGEPVELGVLCVMSGDAAYLGIDQSRGVELAIARRNGQVLGHPIELQVEDSRCTSEGGTTAALKIVADPQAIAIVGPTCSGAATTAAKVMSEAGLVMISGSNAAPSLTAVNGERGADWQPGYFRTASNDAVAGWGVATFAFQELGVTKAATINDGDPYTKGLVDRRVLISIDRLIDISKQPRARRI